MWAIVVFAVACGIVFYLIIGYPLLLMALRGRSGPAIRKDLHFQTTVSAVMAVHNGAAFLRAKLHTLLGLNYPLNLLDIVVVSDGSTDETDDIAREFAQHRVRLIRVSHGGKAAALNAGLAQATGEILFFTDVRQPLEPSALNHLVANFADPTVGAVTGELRYIQPGSGEQADLDLYWRYELWARAQHSRIDSLFNTTGCIYAMRRSLTEPLPEDTLTDDAVLPLRAFLRGYRVIFDPEAIAYDYPAVTGTEFRRRMRTLAGMWQVHARLPRLFTGANRMRLHFLSHKFGRLVLPWAILLVFASTVAMTPSHTRTFLLADEGVLCALAVLDRLIPAWFPLKRISSPARTFLTMNVAALLSVMVFFVSPKALWTQTRVQRQQT